MAANEVAGGLARVKALRDRQAGVFRAVNATHAGVKRKTEEVPELDEETVETLQKGYQEAFSTAAAEYQAASAALEKLLLFLEAKHVRDVKRRREVAEYTRDLGVVRGDIWAHNHIVLPANQLVAANTDSNSEIKTWILSSVQKYNQGRERYQIVDADPSPATFKKIYTLDACRVVPLYSLEKYPLNKRRVMRPGDRVMAMFPETTTFYPCNVVASPRGKNPVYKLIFDDDDEQERTVDARYVFPFPKGYVE